MLWLVCSVQIFEVDTHLNRLILLAIHRYSCEINLFLPHFVCGAVQTAEVSPSDHCSAVSHCGSGRKTPATDPVQQASAPIESFLFLTIRGISKQERIFHVKMKALFLLVLYFAK